VSPRTPRVDRSRTSSGTQRARPRDDKKDKVSKAAAPPTRSGPLVYSIPAGLTAALAAMSFLPRVQENAALTRSFWGAAAMLLAMQGLLLLRLRGGSIARSLTFAAPRAQHYVQAVVQGSVYLYWGWHWRPVYEHAWLLVAQLVFAYAFDMLLSWWRRDTFVLGFGPFPIIFSINLFLWFRDDWFYLQFLLVAVGFLGKELVRWERDGKRVHIFNPSAFSLGLFSIVLIATGTTSLTWGPEIASTLSLAPRIYTFLFAGGLVVMYFFAITPLAASAAATLFAASAIYSAVTGVPYFLDTEIPAAVFLGLHLLVTDPSTSPRTPFGKVIFGVGYGLGVFGLYSLLGAIGSPTFYDKLLCVPLLNLCVRRIDAWVHSIRSSPMINLRPASWVPARANLAHMALWIALFGAMTASGRTDGRHTGDSLPFWQQACAEDRPTGCKRLLQLEAMYCGDNSGWACNELGAQYVEGGVAEANSELALGYFSRACELRFQAGCLNLLSEKSRTTAPPKPLDLRLLLREGGKNLMEMPEPQLYQRACEHAWTFACGRSSQ
jgi:hypothetical protein